MVCLGKGYGYVAKTLVVGVVGRKVYFGRFPLHLFKAAVYLALHLFQRRVVGFRHVAVPVWAICAVLDVLFYGLSILSASHTCLVVRRLCRRRMCWRNLRFFRVSSRESAKCGRGQTAKPAKIAPGGRRPWRNRAKMRISAAPRREPAEYRVNGGNRPFGACFAGVHNLFREGVINEFSPRRTSRATGRRRRVTQMIGVGTFLSENTRPWQ